jgi:hypothetical protein
MQTQLCHVVHGHAVVVSRLRIQACEVPRKVVTLILVKVEAAVFSEMFVHIFRTTRRYVTDDLNVNGSMQYDRNI